MEEVRMHYPTDLATMTKTSDTDSLVSGMRQGAGGERCVLVVDDDSTVRMVLTRALEGAGYLVLRAMDGVEALEYLESKAVIVDLVLTDIRMPRLGGLELGREIAARQWPIQVLYMSADPPPALGGDGAGTALARCLWKPFSMASLIATIGQLLAP